ncbi:Membrane-anchored ribosome-binding protein, inhibits growth in stationary phase, ElaB/YqjD/DUF883 family [Fulvimarina manganoxydans]|uniref:Membrane-anchored ribosome-binding protein, inhibits growth in stationary phase, ElaB/YqjD/DUF883 family n=1 Tax=Fulvimarina manganoxydans TaxID=937218 RepID=A0A1W2CRZ6_9HYPH|nr:DUF883 family protein [Fulvimarina manganoxydans]MEE2950805.1 DUF883 family protein [Pseudomonadota bacterium]SMC87990.1 Membrane-anchored ribosome-binding protein, inhibits growth in stationary phase, ElaB/YqjD/DUF883 family [Fulvimarina manganoxydans]
MASDTTPHPQGTSTTGGTMGAGPGTHAGQSDREQLEAQIAKLREDVSGITDSLKQMATHRAEGARGQAYALRDDVKAQGERYLRQAQDAASDLEEQMSDRIRDEPIKSVLIAAAVGYLYARLFR